MWHATCRCRYAHFSECVSGVTVIRAFGCQDLEVAACQAHVDLNQRAGFVSNAGTQWLALRLQSIGVTILACMAYMAVVERAVVDSSASAGTGGFSGLAGLTGLGLSYALPIVGSLEGLIGSFAQTEKEMVCTRWRCTLRVGCGCLRGVGCACEHAAGFSVKHL